MRECRIRGRHPCIKKSLRSRISGYFAGQLPSNGGQFGSIGGQARSGIARLDPTNGLADSFDPNADFRVNAIAVQADGKILVGGEFGLIGGQTRNNIARLHPATGLADSFDPNASIVEPVL